mmetsp:Transcript_36146/g.84454  ORF Transcript_36146/g.84454 Transcript_36146/m.84454 type:complete len:214 (+) Transcript_36146:859-1500(+)
MGLTLANGDDCRQRMSSRNMTDCRRIRGMTASLAALGRRSTGAPSCSFSSTSVSRSTQSRRVAAAHKRNATFGGLWPLARAARICRSQAWPRWAPSSPLPSCERSARAHCESMPLRPPRRRLTPSSCAMGTTRSLTSRMSVGGPTLRPAEETFTTPVRTVHPRATREVACSSLVLVPRAMTSQSSWRRRVQWSRSRSVAAHPRPTASRSFPHT